MDPFQIYFNRINSLVPPYTRVLVLRHQWLVGVRPRALERPERVLVSPELLSLLSGRFARDSVVPTESPADDLRATSTLICARARIRNSRV